uniref:Uncharacterized protein n=1 Tax=Arundo donax TaxID=35708 RepID=A0A0A9EZH4_ARUDO
MILRSCCVTPILLRNYLALLSKTAERAIRFISG